MLARKLVILVIGGLLSCADQSAAAQAKAPPVSTPSPVPAATFTPFAGYSADPCYGAKNPDVAASCAQWKAADAAKSSADASWWTVYFAGLGIALAAITMAAAIAAAIFARKAAYQNKRSADAAHDANRPWLDIEIKLHGVSVNFDCKGYSLQLEINPHNAGVSPALDLREHVECLFYDHIPEPPESNPFSFAARDQSLEERAHSVAERLRGQRDAGPTVFPGRDQPLFIETFVPWDFANGYPSAFAWLVVGLRYSFPEGIGETIRVFSIRSFGFADHSGFECMGAEPFATAKIDPVIVDWPRHGSVK
jgi:hypothetical protein